MAEPSSLLSIDGLSISYADSTGLHPAVCNAHLQVHEGERVGLVGESGSGKSTLALAVMGYLAQGGRVVEGSITLRGENIDANNSRATDIAYVPQNPAAALNPLMRMGDQLTEVPIQHDSVTQTEALAEAASMLVRTGITDTDRILRAYPHQISGGQQQRVLIAMALLSKPSLLVLDEPTAALDPTVAAAIIHLIRDLATQFGMSILFISHDLRLIRRTCERVYVMREGEIVEEGTTETLFNAPKHPYTQSLVETPPLLARPTPSAATAPILTVEGLWKSFRSPPRNLAERLRPDTRSHVAAAQDISFTVAPGELTAIVGESGSGKSTLARMLLGLERPDAGSISLGGTEISAQPAATRPAELTRTIQMVFQHPDETLNPSWSVGFQLSRALRKLSGQRTNLRKNVTALLQRTALDPALSTRKPRALSGGQRQRVAIARAIAGAPAILVADEATSALDVSAERDIMALLAHMRSENNMAIFMISHDLALMRHTADRLIVLYGGTIVEEGATEDVFASPSHPYTDELIRSDLGLGDEQSTDVVEAQSLKQEGAGPGCIYHATCRRRIGPICERQAPPVVTPRPGHRIRCHLPLEAGSGKVDAGFPSDPALNE